MLDITSGRAGETHRRVVVPLRGPSVSRSQPASPTRITTFLHAVDEPADHRHHLRSGDRASVRLHRAARQQRFPFSWEARLRVLSIATVAGGREGAAIFACSVPPGDAVHRRLALRAAVEVAAVRVAPRHRVRRRGLVLALRASRLAARRVRPHALRAAVATREVPGLETADGSTRVAPSMVKFRAYASRRAKSMALLLSRQLDSARWRGYHTATRHPGSSYSRRPSDSATAVRASAAVDATGSAGCSISSGLASTLGAAPRSSSSHPHSSSCVDCAIAAQRGFAQGCAALPQSPTPAF